MIFGENWVGGRARVTIDEDRSCVVTTLNRNLKVVEILRMVC